MVARVTRSSLAKEVSKQASTETTTGPVQLSSPPATPEAPKGRKRKTIQAEAESATPLPVKKQLVTPKRSSRKRPQAAVKNDEDIDELPHNLGTTPNLTLAAPTENGSPAKKYRKSRKSSTVASPKKEDITENVDELVAKATATPDVSPKKAKNISYGLTPGQTPYPNWPHPTAGECEEVNRLLSTVHGDIKPPKSIPMPSLTVSGCGEVPSVLDALIRTRLSAATSGTNSSRAFAGLVAKFGVLQEGIGKGSVDWNAVRQADTKDIFEAIKSGGLADVKSKDIKAILQMVWEENQARRAELVSSLNPPGSQNEAPEEKNAEIARAEENVLSLDHLHLLSNDDAFNALTKYPGIGPKTASCVLLFCLQRPSFAVDTHVFRLCKWLGWVPPPGDPAGLAPGAKGKFAGPTRNSTYAHCEVRIPDHLKYPLHQLFIKHGKTCPRCRAITGEGSVGWHEGCVIDHLVQRSGRRKDGGASPKKGAKVLKGKGKSRKKREEEVEENEGESSELSDLTDLESVDEGSEYAAA
ncbi:DNA glycosylase [Zopfia rhizophila CBS 207.26]|uniref:DNA glycosylase n=1 Tax=Zopfia rhizophila CBS 207.26 TaxID=1314779 RepID=A0A6A6DGV7_9PEZI|nr:DNA glycosylase [Zopfia rhizophila CBS 207.26]